MQILYASLFLVVRYCKVRRANGLGDVLETRNECVRKHCPEDLNGNVCCMTIYSILLESQQILLTGM